MNNLDMDLLLFTNYFPYKSANKEIYLESELPELARQFRKVVIFPEIITEECRSLPANVEIVKLDDDQYNWKRALKGNWFLFLKLALSIPFLKLPRSYSMYRISTLIHCFYRASKFRKWLVAHSDEHPYICYSYWFYNWATTLGILRKQGVIKQFISRSHANDLYEYVGAYKWIPHRRFQMQQVAHVFTISRYGAAYLKERYPTHTNKISHHYLGTVNQPAGPPSDKQNYIHIISCSNLAPVKRVHLIPEILSHMQSPFIWTHIGSGKEQDVLNQKIAEFLPWQTVHLLGYKDNREVQAFYRENPIDLFLNVSSSEGVPVSIMEAISAGIPVIATSVGGTAEVVNTDFGCLLDKDFDPRQAAAELDKYYQLKQKGLLQPLKIKARQYWEQHFNAADNYRQFANSLKAFAN
ncbi:MAG: glycosyltransferase [Flavihumibacter sp.]|nr:glycosyltransferase [Flavihumibacter sp.]